jgi:hypothetical protein
MDTARFIRIGEVAISEEDLKKVQNKILRQIQLTKAIIEEVDAKVCYCLMGFVEAAHGPWCSHDFLGCILGCSCSWLQLLLASVALGCSCSQLVWLRLVWLRLLLTAVSRDWSWLQLVLAAVGLGCSRSWLQLLLATVAVPNAFSPACWSPSA